MVDGSYGGRVPGWTDPIESTLLGGFVTDSLPGIQNQKHPELQTGNHPRIL